MKRQFGHMKVRYRGLAENTARLHTPFALSNLWMAWHQLLQGSQASNGQGTTGEPETGSASVKTASDFHCWSVAEFHVMASGPLSAGTNRILNINPN